MVRWSSAAAILAAFLLAGCDEEKQSAKGPVQTDPPAAQAETKTESAIAPDPAQPVELPVAAAQAKAAAAPDQPASDPGRVTFDGDKPRGEKAAMPSAVFAGGGSLTAKTLAAYNQAARGDTLAVREPPVPAPFPYRGRGRTDSVGAGRVDVHAAQLAWSKPAADGPRSGSGTGETVNGSVRASGRSTRGDAASGSCPDGMAKVEGYCVDKYEGSLVVSRDGGDKMWPPNYKLEDGLVYKAVSRAAVKPQGYISGDQAAAACAQAGKRLCSMKEWVKACQGPMKTQYPYGAAYEAGACNEFDHKDHTGHRSAMHRLHGDNASFDYKTMNDPRLDAMSETVAPSGSFSKCTNGYGVYDMVGNVHEWVSDHAGGRGVFKGGYFEDTHLNGDGCRYTTTAHETSYHDYSTGFRCCAGPS